MSRPGIGGQPSRPPPRLLEESQKPIAAADAQRRDSGEGYRTKQAGERKRACRARQPLRVFVDALTTLGRSADRIGPLSIAFEPGRLLWRACDRIRLHRPERRDVHFKQAKVVANLAPPGRSSGRGIELRFLARADDRHALADECLEIAFGGPRQLVGFAARGCGAVAERPVPAA